ncbi:MULTISPECIES: four helix bundle protein [unclassified Flavobacterium]|uniref:four helix bundle protein n=1 Tax=unclassified Flavobacterium TaxID=196869 RepID=UPI001F132D3B|nr:MULTISPECIES: four helix bundle protein [unclassified Flavobacterium]UMY66435.1 four helix bundle protein [Flavobacterium sp. HJ-32-4]
MPELRHSGSALYSQNTIVRLTFEFSIAVILYAEQLEQRKKFILSNQLLRSGTSIGANVKEAQNAESKADFVHKMKIALKEADETEYWINLCSTMAHYPDTRHLEEKLEVVLKILNKIVGTSKRHSHIR